MHPDPAKLANRQQANERFDAQVTNYATIGAVIPAPLDLPVILAAEPAYSNVLTALANGNYVVYEPRAKPSLLQDQHQEYRWSDDEPIERDRWLREHQ